MNPTFLASLNSAYIVRTLTKFLTTAVPSSDISQLILFGIILRELLRVVTLGNLYRALLKYGTCEMHFERGDETYTYMLKFIEGRFRSKHYCPSLIATVGTENCHSGPRGTLQPTVDPETGYFNYRNVRAPTVFQPYNGHRWFWDSGRLYMFERSPRSVLISALGVEPGSETFSISQLGWNNKGLKDLCAKAQDKYFNEQEQITPIYRPTLKSQRLKAFPPWNLADEKSYKGIDTVILDEPTKKSFLDTLNDYLHPETPNVYARCGRPYRLGVLFEGPTGTGKSSLCEATASHFGLPIYYISLGDRNLSDEDLMLLVGAVPKRSIVVLEDIDSAGLSRQRPRDTANADDHVTLSGLLNALDGVAASTGRVVILTTNHPERLDEALKRPGRTDITVEFRLTRRREMEKMFELMSRARRHAHSSTVGPEEIRVLAKQFAEQLPENMLSAGQLQGYLIERMEDPQRAAAEASILSNKGTEAKEVDWFKSASVMSTSAEVLIIPSNDFYFTLTRGVCGYALHDCGFPFMAVYALYQV